MTLRSLGPTAVLAALAATQLATPATAQVNIIVSWTEAQHEIRPRQSTWRVSKSIRLALHGGNKISEIFTADNNAGRSAKLDSSGQFRDSLQTGSRPSSWRVESDKTLVRTWDRAQHVETMRVTVGPGNTCNATIAYSLKSGFHEYRMQSISLKVPLYFSSVSAEQIKCRASSA